MPEAVPGESRSRAVRSRRPLRIASPAGGGLRRARADRAHARLPRRAPALRRVLWGRVPGAGVSSIRW